MTISIKTEKTHTLVEIHDNFDAQLVLEAHIIFSELAQNADRNIILDLSQVEHLDSSGIGAIVYLFKRLHVIGFNLELREIHGQPLRLIEQLHIDDIISVSEKSPDYIEKTNGLTASPKQGKSA